MLLKGICLGEFRFSERSRRAFWCFRVYKHRTPNGVKKLLSN